jgi:hypothetical protein
MQMRNRCWSKDDFYVHPLDKRQPGANLFNQTNRKNP